MLRASKYHAQDNGKLTQDTIGNNTWIFESGRWFLCSYTHSKVCVRVLNSLHPCVGEFESLFHSKKQMRDFETNGMNRGWANKVWVDEKGENRLQRGKEFDIHRWLRQFHVDKLLRVGE